MFELCNHKNYELKMCANEAIEKICMHISDCLLEKNTLHKFNTDYQKTERTKKTKPAVE